MLDRTMITIDASDRNDLRLYPPQQNYDRWWTLGLAGVGSLIIYPFIDLSYLHFPLAFAGFTMLPFLLAVVVWFRDATK